MFGRSYATQGQPIRRQSRHLITREPLKESVWHSAHPYFLPPRQGMTSQNCKSQQWTSDQSSSKSQAKKSRMPWITATASQHVDMTESLILYWIRPTDTSHGC